MEARILVLEDDEQIKKQLDEGIGWEKAKVKRARNKEEAIKLAEKEEFDVVVFERDGSVNEVESFINYICSNGKPKPSFVIITDKGKKHQQLSLKEDEVLLTKPYAPFDLVLKVLEKIQKRRRAKSTSFPKRFYHFSDVKVDALSRSITKAGKEIYLRPKEFKVLLLLMENPGRVFSRQELKNIVWGERCPSDLKTIEVTLSSLRKKVEGKELKGKHIVTVRGGGYTFQF